MLMAPTHMAIDSYDGLYAGDLDQLPHSSRACGGKVLCTRILRGDLSAQMCLWGDHLHVDALLLAQSDLPWVSAAG